MSRWFRLHDEILDDPKVQRLSGEDFKTWVNLLCLASRKEGKLPPVADIAFALRMSEDAVSTVLERLLDGGLIVSRSGGADGMHYAPHKWEERQYKSDTSTARVKRFRERSKPVAETAPDTETEQSNTLAKANAVSADTDQVFWANAKAYLKPFVKGDPGALIGKWRRDHGKPATADAITRAQLDRPVDPVAFVQGCFRQRARNGYGVEHSGVPL
jgi:predicted transcriptional regulator